MDNDGQWMLLACCAVPYLAGFLTCATLFVRVGKFGWWGVLPFGGALKHWWMEKQG